MLSENGDVYKIIMTGRDHSTVSIQNAGETLPCGFNFAGRYIERCKRRVHVSPGTKSALADWTVLALI